MMGFSYTFLEAAYSHVFGGDVVNAIYGDDGDAELVTLQATFRF